MLSFLKKIPFSYLWIFRRAMGKYFKTVLDLGCGDGSFTKALKGSEEWEITGVDIYSESIKKASKMGIYMKLIKGDINTVCENLIRNRKKFDVVLCSQTIEHLPRGRGIKLLSLVEKLAKKRIVFSTPRGFMKQTEKFLAKNPYQNHRSGWSENDFRIKGYKVYGVGFAPVWSEKGLARTRNVLVRSLYTCVSFFMSPLVYFYPKFGAGIICIKNINRNNEKLN